MGSSVSTTNQDGNGAMGYTTMKNPFLNKGLGFTLEERITSKLDGLLPPGVLSMKVQVDHVMAQMRGKSSNLEKYLFLQSLQDTNENLYYACLCKHTYECMPLVYTPTVGQACIEFSNIYRSTPRGLYIPITKKGKVRELLDNWPIKTIKAIVFTDGERILGLGDQGIDGMGIPIGKLALYTACAGVPPDQCLPITLDVGTNNQEKINSPFYMGLKQPRVTGEEYDAFVDEFMMAAVDAYGRSVMLQFEDFGNSNAFRLLDRWMNRTLSFNDDIQGTASVILAGLMASVRITGQPLSEGKYLFYGAGEAGVGIADLIAYAISKETGISEEDARKQIFLIDSKGLVVKSRLESLQHHKLAYAHDIEHCSDLLSAVQQLKPTHLLGVSTIPQSFTKEVCSLMAELNENPCIFALSNPTSKAECTAEQAYEFTDGKAIYASGSPFEPVMYKGKKYTPGQGNNAYIFPGVGLGAVAVGATRLDMEDMYLAAKALSQTVSDERLAERCVYPHLQEIRQVSVQVAAAIAENAYARGTVDGTVPQPEDLVGFLTAAQYEPEY